LRCEPTTFAQSASSTDKPLRKLDQHAPVGRVRYLVECNDEPQTFNDGHIDLIFLEQPQQSIAGRFVMACAHIKRSSIELKMPTREDDLRELTTSLSAAIEKARRLDLPTSAYVMSMALVEVSQALKAIETGKEDDVGR
jgi:hypothetical protein